jgi:hypothetical protein
VRDDPPVALDLWWQHVGAVDLVGDFTALIPEETRTIDPYNNGRYLDALSVMDVDRATRETHWQTWNGGETDGTDAYVDITADFVSKAGYSGAGAVCFYVPAGPDPMLQGDNDAWPSGVTFTEMVKVSMSWAALPGLRNFVEVPSELRHLVDYYGQRYGRSA